MSAFADRLREVREGKGLSQYALAKRSGLTKQAISRLELGGHDPTWTTVQRLALALGVDYGAFADRNLTLPEASSEPPKPKGRPRKAAPVATEQKPKKRKKGA